MASLNVDPSYPTHRKTIRLCSILGDGADILPIRLWCYVAVHFYQDGKLADLTEPEIEKIIQWWGKKPGQCVKALLDVKFLCQNEDKTFYCYAWLEHNGHIAAYKERAKKAAASRYANMRKENAQIGSAPVSPDLSKHAVHSNNSIGSVLSNSIGSNGSSLINYWERAKKVIIERKLPVGFIKKGETIQNDFGSCSLFLACVLQTKAEARHSSIPYLNKIYENARSGTSSPKNKFLIESEKLLLESAVTTS